MVHSKSCECFGCLGVPVPLASDVQTCGAPACVEAWRRFCASGRVPEKVGPTPEERRVERLKRALVPVEFRAPFDESRLNEGRPVQVVARRRNGDGAIVDVVGDIMDHAIHGDHPHTYIWGPFQSGKTRVATDILSRALASVEVSSATWTSTARLATGLAGHRLGEPYALEKRCSEDRLLLLDDVFLIGEGHRSREAMECVTRILQCRWDNALPTIVTSDRPPVSRDKSEDTLATLMAWYYERIQQGIQVAIKPLD
jgi:hypothetical protein